METELDLIIRRLGEVPEVKGDVRVDERLLKLLDDGEVITTANAGSHLLLELPHELFVDPTLPLPKLRLWKHPALRAFQVANAVAAAGARCRDLPLLPERVLDALERPEQVPRCLLPAARLAEVPGDCGFCWRLPGGGHGTRGRAGCSGPLPEPGADCGRHNDHDAQDIARPPRRPDSGAQER